MDIDVEKGGWKRGCGGDNLCHAAPTSYLWRTDFAKHYLKGDVDIDIEKGE